jgi:hypothetical protein
MITTDALKYLPQMGLEPSWVVGCAQPLLCSTVVRIPDLLGAAYEYLIKFFADSAGNAGCCARAVSGQATAPPRSVMKPRRFN